MKLRILTLILGMSLLSGCLDTKGTSSEIVIPPGGLIQLELTDVNKVSEQKYSLYLTEYLQAEKKTKNLMDLTTEIKPSLIRQILPKGLKTSGATVAKVVMEYRTTPWFAVVFPDMVTPISLESTLVYNLLSAYPGRALSSYSVSEVQEISAAVAEFKTTRMAMFGIASDFNPDLLYRFVRNGLSNDPAFLALLKNYNINFDFNTNGDILAEPFPFGIQNRPPKIDETATTRFVDQTVDEMKPLQMRATARDPDGDQVFYAWMFEGSLVPSTDGIVAWTPDYEQGRPDPYQISVILSDGGQITRVDWNVLVNNVNRRPLYTHNCNLNAVEGVEWVCKVSYSDPDGNKVSAKLQDIDGSPLLKLNGSLAPSQVDDANEVEIRWTPNNEDARKKSATIILELTDELLGMSFASLNLTVADNNKAPKVLGGVNIVYNDPYEYDYCAQEIPDGVPPFRFYLDFQDPDNVGATPANPPDVITYSTGGTLSSYMTLVSTQVLLDRVRVTYDWKPTHTVKTGTFIITLKDNHGAISAPVTFNLTSQDRNTKPCLAASNVNWSFNPTLYQTGNTNNTASDRDSDPLWNELFGFQANASFDILRLIEDCSTTSPIYLKQNITQSEPTYRRNAATLCIRGHRDSEDWNSGPGHVLFSRATEHTAAVTIPKDFVLTSTTAGYLMQFKTLYAVTLDPGDLKAWIPVVAINRDAAINKVTVLGSALSDANVKVRNDVAISDRGTVTFYRTVAGPAVTIPAGFIVKAAEVAGTPPSVPSNQFEVPAEVIFPAAAGASTLTVPVWRKIQIFPTGTALNLASQPGGPVLAAQTVVGLADWNEVGITTEPVYNSIVRKFNVRVIDGAKPAVNTINAFVDALPAAASNLKVANPTVFDFQGKARFTRPTSTTAISLPIGTKVTTVNRTQYELAEVLNMPIGTATKDAWIRRINNIGSTTTAPIEQSRLYTMTFNRGNNPSRLITNAVIQAYEGVDLQNGAIELSDSAMEIPNPLYQVADYWYPKDRRDFYRIMLAVSGTGPTGPWKICREPGAFASTCNTCDSVTANLPPVAYRTYFKSAKCYLRYQPNANDLSGTFSFKLSAWEYNNYVDINTFSSYLNFQTNLTLIVNEVNHPPILTNNTFTTLPAGTGAALATPLYLGDYAEGTSGYFNIYVKDTNKGGDLKTDNFELDPQIYDLKTSTWRPIPSGIKVSVDKMEDLTVSSGSKTTARITWNPTDADAKKFSGSAGLVVKVRIYDSKSTPDLTTSIYAYYKIRLLNRNQIPSIGSIVPDNKLTVFADTYVKTEFYLYDNDAYTPEGGSFATLLTLCRDSNGNPLQHPTLDSGAANPYVCHATTATFSAEVTTYDPTYDRNRTISQCYSGGVLNTDLAVPKFSPVGATEVVNGVLRQKYRMEWCPQRGHIGHFSAELDVNDNGDVDRDGVVSAAAVSATPLQLSVIAPVFMVSPRVDINNVPVHFMPQTAANMSSQPFRYEVIVNNSQEHALQFSLLDSPRACELGNGMCIDPNTGVITWVPSYPTDVTTDPDPGKLVRVQVKDLVTNEVDSAHFYLKVQNPLSPFEQAPVINSSIPSSSSVLLAEKATLNFSVSATDPNANDTLFYRWYVNDKLRADESSTFAFKPSDTDGSFDPDGNGPRKAGEFSVRVDVTDGNYVTSKSWEVKVRNTFLLGETLFNLTNARPESLPSQTPLSVNWTGEIAYSQQYGSNNLDHLIFVGNYMMGVFQKHFLWDLLLVNGDLSKPNGTVANPPWNFTEDLPWLSGTTTTRVAINPLSTGFDMLMTSKASRAGPFGLTTEALHIMNGDLTSLSLSSSNKCAGDCPLQLYTSPYYSDSRITTSMDSTYVFYASDTGTQLFYDYLSPAVPVSVYNFGTAKISGMTLNRAIDRLYVTTQQTLPSVSHKIFVFNVAPARSGGVPSLVAQLSIWDGVVGHEDCKPSDIVTDPMTNKVYALLSGTGGVVSFADSASTTPTVGGLQFIGVSELNGSPFDVPGQGHRLVIRSDDRLLLGTFEGANQVFTVDLTDNHVYVSAVQDPINSIASYSSGQILLVSRSRGKVFKAK